jgi:hypothetical protein
MRCWLAMLFLLIKIIAPVQAMTFKVEASDNPIDPTYNVYANGEIVTGDAEGLLNALQSAKVHFDRRITVFLHSPGGSVVQALKLGRLITTLNADTSVGQPGSPGDCLSACVWAYLGGDYRFLPDQSRIGVHQFAFGNENNIQTGTATAITQTLAAEIEQFIKQSRADTDFFKLVTSALPSDIYFVPHDKLRELRVVTDHIWDESWSYEYMKGFPTYLKIWQQSFFGENKLMLFCANDQLLGEAFLQTPKFMPMHTVGIFINHQLVTIPQKLKTD